MIKSTKEKAQAQFKTRDESIEDAEEIKEGQQIIKEWQINALNELLEPMSTNIDSKLSQTHISPDFRSLRKTGTTFFSRENWTATGNQR